VFVINNNQWAISVPRREQTRALKLSDKAIAAGLPGEQVDGNDVIAVREAITRALARARAGDGGTLIECLSYRLGDHTTADDASRYRDETEVSPHWKEEPLIRLHNHLVEAHGYGKDDEKALLRSCGDEIDAAAEAYLATGPEPARAMFEHLYATPPADIAVQASEVGDD
jgi:pyruvate dehydrogenase E1 component alpha subunit